MGRLAVQHLVSQIQGQETEAKDIDTGVTVVTAANIGSYTK
jgi:ribose transport system substrate-binding protein